MRAVLRRKDFRRLFAGVVTAMVGETALLLVLAIWVKDLTGSNSLAGLTIFAVVAPALAAPVLGWVVDRFRRKPFLVATLVATVVALTPLLLVRGREDVWIIYVIGVLYGTSMILVSSALNALIKTILPEQLLAEGNAALQTVRQGLRLVGPLGGAALYTLFGERELVVFVMACLALGALTLSTLAVSEPRPEPAVLNWLGEAVAGVRHLVGERSLRRTTIGLTIAVGVVGITETAVFAYVDEGLHRPAAFVSVLVCAQGVGGVGGGLIAAGFVRRLGEIGATAVGVIAFGVGFAGLTYPQLALAFVSAFVVGAGIPLAIVGFNTLMQRVTDSAMLGRVAAAAEAVISLPQALSIAAGAALVAVIDFRLLFAGMAIVMMIAAAYLWAGRHLSPASAPSPASASASPASAPASPASASAGGSAPVPPPVVLAPTPPPPTSGHADPVPTAPATRPISVHPPGSTKTVTNRDS